MSKDGHTVDGPLGRIELTGAALAGVVATAAESVEGARVHRPRRGLDVELDGGRARVSIELTAPLGVVIPELARAVQEQVAAALGATAGVEVAGVDVSIEELET